MKNLLTHWSKIGFWKKFLIVYGSLILVGLLFFFLPYFFKAVFIMHGNYNCGDLGGLNCSLGDYLSVPIFAFLFYIFFSFALLPDFISSPFGWNMVIVSIPIVTILSMPISICIHYLKKGKKN